jgi:hypothetical protein
MLIKTAKQQYGVQKAGGNYRVWLQGLVNMRWGKRLIDWKPAREPVRAWINKGDWAVNCPDCPESLIAEPGEPFFCPHCLNVKNGGRVRPVVFPENRVQIEAALLRRIDPNRRNWYPHETLDQLLQENAAHSGEVI